MIKQDFTRVSTMLLTMIAVVAAAITTPITTAIAQEIFESEELGFRMQVPEGWAAQDLTREEGYTEFLESIGVGFAAILCKENEALPGIGGTYYIDGLDICRANIFFSGKL